MNEFADQVRAHWERNYPDAIHLFKDPQAFFDEVGARREARLTRSMDAMVQRNPGRLDSGLPDEVFQAVVDFRMSAECEGLDYGDHLTALDYEEFLQEDTLEDALRSLQEGLENPMVVAMPNDPDHEVRRLMEDPGASLEEFQAAQKAWQKERDAEILAEVAALWRRHRR